VYDSSMINRTDIENMAKLARIAISETEADKLAGDLESILGYVSELDKAPISTDGAVSKSTSSVTNVTRIDDENIHETGACKEDLLAEAPARSGDFVKVKPVF
jgi:aspartyl-tRNA(Asn)/glutamyl-tRNA(Gln) amidotransferase subunit C